MSRNSTNSSRGRETRVNSPASNEDDTRSVVSFELDLERAEHCTEVCTATRVHLRVANPEVLRVRILKTNPT
ncbi:hypothetical protein PM082_001173 [Marasmius tenuissimus]|nr:hypothetical protein PM082_001173 [Marasmius tenuissimus]